jgi:hypothetical protein
MFYEYISCSILQHYAFLFILPNCTSWTLNKVSADEVIACRSTYFLASFIIVLRDEIRKRCTHFRRPGFIKTTIAVCTNVTKFEKNE